MTKRNRRDTWALIAVAVVLLAGTLPAQDAGLTFYVPFEDGAAAATAGGNAEPLEQGKRRSQPGDLVPGIKGNGMRFGHEKTLYYSIPGNYDNARGSLSFWFKVEQAPEKLSRHAFFFYELGPYEKGSQILRIMMHANNAVFYNFADERGRWSITPFNYHESEGEWHQVVLTWDKDVGDRIYIDGRFRRHRGGYTGTQLHNFQRGTEQYDVMQFMRLNPDIEVVLDEVRIYDRMLSEEEIAERYTALFPVRFDAAPTVMRQGRAENVAVSISNRGESPVKGVFRYRLTRDDELVIEGSGESVAVASGLTVTQAVTVTPPADGEYRLLVSLRDSVDFSRGHKLCALPADMGAAAMQVQPTLDLALVQSFDCTQEYGSETYCDDGFCDVVEGPAGRYRRTSPDKPWSRFVYRFEVEEARAPYVAEIEYPDDAERIMEIMIDNPSGSYYQQLEAGLIMGGEYPNTDTMKTVRYLFWPRDRECVIQIMDWPVGRRNKRIFSAACRSIKIYEVRGGLPRVKMANLPPPDKQRVIGYEEENGTFYRLFNNEPDESRAFGYDRIYTTLDRLTSYSAFVGMNLFTYPLIHYHGAMYPSAVNPMALGRGGYHPDYWVELAMGLCEQRGVKFFGGMCWWDDPILQRSAFEGPDREGVIRGEDTVLQVAWNGDINRGALGHDVKYDILHPAVEQRILDMFQNLLDHYGIHPAFGGMSVWCMPLNSFWFGGLKWGYSDRDIALFEEETGINVPGEAPDPKRFLKRYVFLVREDPDRRERWIGWRCRKVRDLWTKISERVRAVNPDLWVTVYPDEGYEEVYYAIWRPWDPDSVAGWYREGGIDFDMLGALPNILPGRSFDPNYRPPPETRYTRDFDMFAPACVKPLASANGNSVWLEQGRWEFDRLKHAQPLKGYWWTDDKGREKVPAEKSGSIMPHGDFYLEAYANSLADLDAWYISDGGIVMTQLGHEPELREFARAYRTIPAEHFAVFGNVNDPVCVRYRARGDGYCFYLVNREFYPVTATLTFKGEQSFALLDLPADQRHEIDGPFRVEVGPFRVRAFRAPKDVALQGVQVSAPDKWVQWLKKRVESFLADWKRLASSGLQLNGRTRHEIEWLSNAVKQAWEERRYSRCRHLLDSYHAEKFKRILRDEELQSYLSVPDAYIGAFFGPARAAVARLKDIPPIDSELWGQHVVTDTFAEVMPLEGKYIPRPAEARTLVSAVYDEAALGFRFRCLDESVDEVQAKQVERDGCVIGPDDDSVEIFLSHAEGNVPYYHFMANYGGSFKDRKAPEAARWYDPDWDIQTAKTDKAWLARIVIPFKALDMDGPPETGAHWGLNLCRNKRGTYVAFRCDPDRGFHCPRYFATLAFQ